VIQLSQVIHAASDSTWSAAPVQAAVMQARMSVLSSLLHLDRLMSVPWAHSLSGTHTHKTHFSSQHTQWPGNSCWEVHVVAIMLWKFVGVQELLAACMPGFEYLE
jgi:hypothetical protein